MLVANVQFFFFSRRARQIRASLLHHYTTFGGKKGSSFRPGGRETAHAKTDHDVADDHGQSIRGGPTPTQSAGSPPAFPHRPAYRISWSFTRSAWPDDEHRAAEMHTDAVQGGDAHGRGVGQCLFLQAGALGKMMNRVRAIQQVFGESAGMGHAQDAASEDRPR
jgi:hypothetical protein